MSDEINQLKGKVQEHNERLQAMEQLSERNVQETAALIGNISDLTDTLQKFSVTFAEYAANHDNLAKSNEKLWVKFDAVESQVAELKTQQAVSDTFIAELKQIKSRIAIIVITALMSPIAMGAAYFFKGATG